MSESFDRFINDGTLPTKQEKEQKEKEQKDKEQKEKKEQEKEEDEEEEDEKEEEEKYIWKLVNNLYHIDKNKCIIKDWQFDDSTIKRILKE